MKKYAISPLTTDFIQEGKEYPIKTEGTSGFSIDKELLEFPAYSDLYCSFENCHHLNNSKYPDKPVLNWKIIKKK